MLAVQVIDKSGPGKIHEVILVETVMRVYSHASLYSIRAQWPKAVDRQYKIMKQLLKITAGV